jgi:hypothetical protein
MSELENYQKMLKCHLVARLAVEAKMKLPEYYKDLGVLRQRAEYAKAYDRACAAELGIRLDEAELEEKYRDRSEEEAEEWAKQLPDMPKAGYNSYSSRAF